MCVRRSAPSKGVGVCALTGVCRQRRSSDEGCNAHVKLMAVAAVMAAATMAMTVAVDISYVAL
jgi:hypothetical protein